MSVGVPRCPKCKNKLNLHMERRLDGDVWYQCSGVNCHFSGPRRKTPDDALRALKVTIKGLAESGPQQTERQEELRERLVSERVQTLNFEQDLHNLVNFYTDKGMRLADLTSILEMVKCEMLFNYYNHNYLNAIGKQINQGKQN